MFGLVAIVVVLALGIIGLGYLLFKPEPNTTTETQTQPNPHEEPGEQEHGSAPATRAHAPDRSGGHGHHAEPTWLDRVIAKIDKVLEFAISISATVGVVLVTALLLSGIHGLYRWKTEPYTPRIPAKEVVEVNPRPEQIRFKNGECYPALVKLAGNWFSYPVGGPVNFVDESGNIVHTSEPGSDKEFTMNDGWYRVCPKEKQTRGVDIIRRPW